MVESLLNDSSILLEVALGKIVLRVPKVKEFIINERAYEAINGCLGFWRTTQLLTVKEDFIKVTPTRCNSPTLWHIYLFYYIMFICVITLCHI